MGGEEEEEEEEKQRAREEGIAVSCEDHRVEEMKETSCSV